MPTQRPDWANGLPLELLQRCLGPLAKQDERAALGACEPLARAVLINSLARKRPARLRLDVDRAEAFSPSAKLAQKLVGKQRGKGLTLLLFSTHSGSPERCLAELRASGVALTCITRLEMQVRACLPLLLGMQTSRCCSPARVLFQRHACSQGLSLDTLIPDDIPTLLPNLRQLRIATCRITAAAAATSQSSAACGRLQHVEVAGLTGEPDHRTSLLTRLARSPSLITVGLGDSSCPTQFLDALTTRLTALHLDRAYRQVQPGTQTPTPPWQATLQHIARCTALQALAIPCATSEELGLVAPALQQLRQLRLNGPGAAVDGDAVVERLLGLPRLTSLTVDNAYLHTFQRSHAGSPSRWRQLIFASISPHQLARLPLHSLTSPVTWSHILVGQRTSVADVQAAVDNMTRRCPAGGAWRPRADNTTPGGNVLALVFLLPPGSDTFTRGAGEGDTPPLAPSTLRRLHTGHTRSSDIFARLAARASAAMASSRR